MKLENLLGKDIMFLPGIEIYAAYPETGMKATVNAVETYPEKGLYKLELNYSKFESENILHESRRFRDANSRCVTYRELNGYDAIESYCVSEAFDCVELVGRVVLKRILVFH